MTDTEREFVERSLADLDAERAAETSTIATTWRCAPSTRRGRPRRPAGAAAHVARSRCSRCSPSPCSAGLLVARVGPARRRRPRDRLDRFDREPGPGARQPDDRRRQGGRRPEAVRPHHQGAPDESRGPGLPRLARPPGRPARGRPAPTSTGPSPPTRCIPTRTSSAAVILWKDRHDPAGAIPEFKAFLASNPPAERAGPVVESLRQAEAEAAAATTHDVGALRALLARGRGGGRRRRGRRRGTGRCRRRWSTSQRRRAGSARRRRPWPRARATARATPTSRRCRSGRRRRLDRARAAPPRPRRPSTPRQTMWGSRAAVSPKATTPSTASAPSKHRSVRARSRPLRRRRRPRPRAAPKPTMAGTFSMPPRRARSWSPPTSSGSSRRPRRTSRAPTPLGPPSLCALTDIRSAPRSSKSIGTWPAGGGGVDVHEHAASRHAATTSATGCTRADLVVGPLAVHERRRRRARRPSVDAAELRRPSTDDAGAARRRVAHRRVLDRGARSPTPPGASRSRPTPRR